MAYNDPCGVPTNSRSSVPPIDRTGALASLWDHARDPSLAQYAVTSPEGLPTRTVRAVAKTRLVVHRSGEA